MKRILLLLVSSLLVLCMAGSAMAISADFPDLPVEDGMPVAYIEPSGDATETLLVVGIDIAGDYDITVETDSDSIQASVEDMSDNAITPWGWLANPAYGSLPSMSTGEHNYKLLMKGDANGIVTVTVQGPDGAKREQKVEVSVDTRIPEFPTVALPIASVLGLLFIFGRKKEEM